MLTQTHNPPSLPSRLMLLLALLALLLVPVARGADIPVVTEGDYQRLLDAIRATEYTRQGYLEDNANLRMVAAVAGLWVFAEHNPLATDEQFAAFVSSYDAALAQSVPADPRLTSPGSLLTAINATRVASEGALIGTDTRVGQDAMRLLGITLPGLESFEQSQNRMARFDVGSVQRTINRSQTADALTATLAGVTPSGRRAAGLETATAAYLESLGYTPMLGQIDPEQTAIDDAIDAELAARGLDNGTTRIDPWGPIEQTATPLVNPVVFVTLAGDGCFDSPIPFNPAHITTSGNGSASSFPHDGFEASISDNRTGSSAAYTRAELAERNALDWRLRTSSTHRPLVEVESIGSLDPYEDNEFDAKVSSIMQGSLRSVRTIRVVVEVEQIFSGGDWGPPPPEYNVINGDICEMVLDHWLGFVSGNGLTLLFPPLQDGDLVGETLPAGEVVLEEQFGWPVPQRYHVDARFRVISDTSTYTHEGTDYLPIQSAFIADKLAEIRTDIRQSIFDDINAPPSSIDDAFAKLDNTSALLDGYLTLGASDALNRGEALRSAFRGIPSSDGLGFRSGDLIAVLVHAADIDDGSIGGAPGVDLPGVETHFIERIGAIASEIDIALSTPAPFFPYVEFVLADLNALVDGAFDLAIDDTYLAEGPIAPDAASGIMANDIGQEGRIDNDDLMVDLDFFASPEHTPPSHGSVSVNADGSFTYTPDQGFEGTDAFSYRLVAQVGDPDNPVGDPNVYSDPALVVLRVTPAACLADFNADGILNFFDVSAFVIAFGNRDPATDFTGDGILNFFDISAFLTSYSTGCP